MYEDLAGTLSNYLVNKYQPEYNELGLGICNMIISKPLVAKLGEQLFRSSATANWKEKTISTEIHSVNSDGQKVLEHAKCDVRLFDRHASYLEWKRVSYLIERAISSLHQKAESGKAHRMQRGIVYRLFSQIIEYDDNFKGIEEVILDSEQYEATARVKFRVTPGNFFQNPFWIDAIGHLTGFVLYAADSSDPNEQIFVNTGWESGRYLKALLPGVEYRTYVKMQPLEGSIWAGDVYLFDGDQIVAVLGCLKVCFLVHNLFFML